MFRMWLVYLFNDVKVDRTIEEDARNNICIKWSFNVFL